MKFNERSAGIPAVTFCTFVTVCHKIFYAFIKGFQPVFYSRQVTAGDKTELELRLNSSSEYSHLINITHASSARNCVYLCDSVSKCNSAIFLHDNTCYLFFNQDITRRLECTSGGHEDISVVDVAVFLECIQCGPVEQPTSAPIVPHTPAPASCGQGEASNGRKIIA